MRHRGPMPALLRQPIRPPSRHDCIHVRGPVRGDCHAHVRRAGDRLNHHVIVARSGCRCLGKARECGPANGQVAAHPHVRFVPLRPSQIRTHDVQRIQGLHTRKPRRWGFILRPTAPQHRGHVIVMAGGHFRSPSRARWQAIHIREQQPFPGGLPDAESQGIALPRRCFVDPVMGKRERDFLLSRSRQQRGQFVGRAVVNGNDLCACWPLLALHRRPARRPMLGVVFDAHDDTDGGLLASGCDRTQRTQASLSQSRSVRGIGHCAGRQ